jgi:hypothetical protein
MRFDHNLFLADDDYYRPYFVGPGPFIYIDNDRSQWRAHIAQYKHGIKDGHRLDRYCIYPKYLTQRLMVLHNNQTESFSLGALLLDSMSVYTKDLSLNGIMFTNEHAKMINADLAYLMSIINRCIQKYGEEQVLIAEPWDSKFSLVNGLDRIYPAQQA